MLPEFRVILQFTSDFQGCNDGLPLRSDRQAIDNPLYSDDVGDDNTATEKIFED
jgi:hypothetical protein